MTDRQAFWLYLLALIAAAGLRFWDLTAEPLHHDEAVNGWFFTNLIHRGEYRYDPANYHGPHFFYLHALIAAIWGEEVLVLRLPVALAGLATVALAWGFRHQIGRPAAAWAAMLIATSPGLVFYSRLLIHETWLGLSFLLLVALWAEASRSRHPAWMLASGVVLGWALTIKETDLVTLGVLMIAAAIAWTLSQVRLPWPVLPLPEEGRMLRRPSLATRAFDALWVPDRASAAPGLALFTAIVVAAAYYTDGFRRMAGLYDKVEAMQIWSNTGFSDFHAKPWSYFLTDLVARHELAIVLAGLLGGALAIRHRNFMAMLMAGWGVGLMMAYAIPPYKTPWLIVTQILPFGLSGGFALALTGRHALGQAVAALVVLANAALSLQVAHRPFLPTDPPERQSGYVYAHSFTESRRLFDWLKTEAAKAEPASLAIIDPSMWPLPWYVIGHPRLSYYTADALPEKLEAEVIIADSGLVEQIRERLPDVPIVTREWPIRPGFALVVVSRQPVPPPVTLPADRG